jgi:hypothetical protein
MSTEPTSAVRAAPRPAEFSPVANYDPERVPAVGHNPAKKGCSSRSAPAYPHSRRSLNLRVMKSERKPMVGTSIPRICGEAKARIEQDVEESGRMLV